MQYRREVDGLRALAVVPVILFHADVSAFSGGFVGVDVFFVISGYLITGIILAELGTGTFSIARFYERRARRILPALFLVMAACLVPAWLWLLPKDLMDFSQSLIAVSGFASNITFWMQSDYFAPAAELKPLLHTWSLAAEEQFYVIFPLFLMLAWRLGRRWLVGVLVIGALISLAASQWAALSQPAAAFFLLPSRAWELAIGALLALYLAGERAVNLPQAVLQMGSLAGALLILLSVFTFSKATPFPGLFALVPTVGAALLILTAWPQTLVGRLLGTKLFVGVGAISYSAYLWHQPLFAFARQMSLGVPSRLTMMLLAAAAIVLAFVSWKYVETPFRSRRFSRKTIFVCSAVASCGFVLIGLTGYLAHGFEGRLSPEQRAIYAFVDYDYAAAYRVGSCHLVGKQTYRDFSTDCPGAIRPGSGLLLWGDSHAAALASGLRAVLPDVGQYTIAACQPIFGTKSNNPRCEESNAFVLRRIHELTPGQVLLQSAWYGYRDRWTAADLEKTIVRIKQASPSSRVVIIGNVPDWQPTLPAYLVRMGVSLKVGMRLKLPQFASIQSVDEVLAAVAARTDSRFLSVLDAICPAQMCQVAAGESGAPVPVSWDSSHLTAAGSKLIAEDLVHHAQGL